MTARASLSSPDKLVTVMRSSLDRTVTMRQMTRLILSSSTLLKARKSMTMGRGYRAPRRSTRQYSNSTCWASIEGMLIVALSLPRSRRSSMSTLWHRSSLRAWRTRTIVWHRLWKKLYSTLPSHVSWISWMWTIIIWILQRSSNRHYRLIQGQGRN